MCKSYISDSITFMLNIDETFFTRVGCMDGRVQIPLRIYGQEKFGAEYPDTITEAGAVRILAHDPPPKFLIALKKKLDISIDKHHSKGILVHGHAECAGNPVEDEIHKDDVRKSVGIIKQLLTFSIPVVGVFVKRSAQNADAWEVEEV